MEWLEPPRITHRGVGNTNVAMEDEANELRANPGKWGVVRTYDAATSKPTSAGGTVNGIRKGRFAAFRPEGAFDAVARKHEDGTIKVHAIYLGEAVEKDLAARPGINRPARKRAAKSKPE